LIEGLLITLPTIGQPWADEDRTAWLKMAESIFAMIYPKTNTAVDPFS
jgi:gluconate kinase